MVKKARVQALRTGDINCACVIHGSAYPWIYVDTLYNMLSRNFSRPVVLHVWTEPHREVPAPFIKHNLLEWPGISGPRKSWWYKMQMFNPEQFTGRLIYFDLDIVIINNLDWMLDLDLRFFWAVHDFRHHFRGAWESLNSSCMIWATEKWPHIWEDFSRHNIQALTRQFQGDQDYLNKIIDRKLLRYLDQNRVRSWRWEIMDGGMDFKKRIYKRPGAGSVVPPSTDIMVFHGQPKPHEISDQIISANWK